MVAELGPVPTGRAREAGLVARRKGSGTFIAFQTRDASWRAWFVLPKKLEFILHA